MKEQEHHHRQRKGQNEDNGNYGSFVYLGHAPGNTLTQISRIFSNLVVVPALHADSFDPLAFVARHSAASARRRQCPNLNGARVSSPAARETRPDAADFKGVTVATRCGSDSRAPKNCKLEHYPPGNSLAAERNPHVT
jgi:hypothetical protein